VTRRITEHSNQKNSLPFAQQILGVLSVAMIAAPALVGCTPVTTTIKTVDVSRYTVTEIDRSASSVKVDSNCQMNRDTISCVFTQTTTCTENTVERSQQKKVIEKKVPPIVQVGEYLGGAVLLGTGIGLVATAENLPTAEEVEMDSDTEWDQESSQIMGSIAIAAGAGLLVLGIVDSARAADEERLLVEKSRIVSTQPVECGNNVLQNTSFSIRQGGTAAPVSFFGEEAYNEYDSDSRILKIRSQEVYSGVSDDNGQAIVRISDLQKVFCPDGGSRAYTLNVGGASVDMSAQFATICAESNAERNRLVALADVESAKQLAASTMRNCQTPAGEDQFEKCDADFKKILSKLPSSDRPRVTAAYETYTVSYKAFKAERNQLQAAEFLKSGKEKFRKKEWYFAKLDAEKCLNRLPDSKECKKLQMSSEKAVDREWAQKQAAEDRKQAAAERRARAEAEAEERENRNEIFNELSARVARQLEDYKHRMSVEEGRRVTTRDVLQKLDRECKGKRIGDSVFGNGDSCYFAATIYATKNHCDSPSCPPAKEKARHLFKDACDYGIDMACSIIETLQTSKTKKRSIHNESMGR